MEVDAIASILFMLLLFSILMGLITEHRINMSFDIPFQIESSQIGSEAKLLELVKKDKHLKLTVKLHTFRGHSFVLVGYCVPEQEYISYVVPLDPLLQKHAKAILMLEKKGTIIQMINEIDNALSNGKRVIMVPK
jgi:hypothetical protein